MTDPRPWLPPARLSRRAVLATGAALGLTSTGLWVPAEAAGRTTLKSRLVPGAAAASGYRKVVTGAGEPHLVRTGLGAAASPTRASRRRAILGFVQISDVHIQDSQSPLRLEFLDRFSDKYLNDQLDQPFATTVYRPQEALTAQVAEAMVRAINAIGSGPVTGTPLAFCLQTGDNSDTGQFNEIRWNIDLLDGGTTVRPDSGDLTKYAGVSDADPTSYDPRYWHPDGTPDGGTEDFARSKYGFPKIPGLLDAARRPFHAEGLSIPWYSVFGNHDQLIQGGFAASTPHLSAVATGNLKLISPPDGLHKDDLIAALNTDFPQFLADHKGTPVVRQVGSDAARRTLTRAEIVDEHFTTTSTPVGHGFTSKNQKAGTAFYSFRQGKVVVVVLDTVNPNGGPLGSLDTTQYAWLKATLKAHEDRLVVIASHHNLRNLGNDREGADAPGARVLGGRIRDLLLRHRQVIAWVNGHSHRHEVRRWGRTDKPGGFWEINTASHIDFPQQSRLLEIVDNGDDTLSIFCTLLDQSAGPDYQHALDTVRHLASLGRELAMNDWQSRPRDRVGTTQDRNVELLLPRPPKVTL